MSDKIKIVLVDRQRIWVNGTAYEVITRADGTVTYSRIGR